MGRHRRTRRNSSRLGDGSGCADASATSGSSPDTIPLMIRLTPALLLCGGLVFAQDIRLTNGPADYQVIQRGANNRADLPLAGGAQGADGAPVEARLLHAGKPVKGFAGVSLGSLAGGNWSGALKAIPA